MKNLKIHVAIIAFFLIVGSVQSAKGQNTDDAPIKINTVLLNIPVIASDKVGHRVAGLKKEDFSIYQDGERQTIDFFADNDAPVTIAIVIDTSSSTTYVLSSIKKSAKNFLTAFGPDDQGMVLSFDYRIRELSKLTSKQNVLKTGIDSAATTTEDQPRGWMGSMYDAVYRVVTKDFASVKGRKAIILLTDGFEGGKITSDELLDTLKESDTLVYPIVYPTLSRLPSGPKAPTREQLMSVSIDVLNAMASSTGGRVISADAANFSAAFQSIADDLKKQYVVGFYPKDGESGKSNLITIKVDRPDVVIRTKRTIRPKTLVPRIKSN